ncbi:hypothetical protein LFM09_41530 [Lentzea alba]|uniref:hypothetical protein n=1 Tax=Lentzea alba TaxID=2714351 RepID=UPI0039BF8F52
MAGTAARLLAAATAGVALLSITTAPAQAQPPRPSREATAALYVFDGGAGQEAITIENQNWSMPEYASGRTQFHPGWSIHLSDEKLGAGLPRQDYKADAHQEENRTGAGSKGFISIIDQNQLDVPFLVLKVDHHVTCSGFVNVPLNLRLFVRKHDGELREAANLNEPATAEAVTGALSADDPKKYDTTVQINSVTKPSQIWNYGPFWKYFERPRTVATGMEVVLTQKPIGGGDPKTYKILVGGAAAVCPE